MEENEEDSRNEEQHLVQLVQCTKDQYDHRDELELKPLNSDNAD